MSLLQALECALQSGAKALPVNVKLLLEGQEEIGSPHLAGLLTEHKQLLSADFVLCLDGGQISATQPSYVYCDDPLTWQSSHTTHTINAACTHN